MPEFKVYLHDAKTNHPYRLDELQAADRASAPAAALKYMDDAFGIDGQEWTIDAVVETDA